MNTTDLIEIELLNGNRIFVPFDSFRKIYSVCEKTRYILEWTCVFPFFKFKKTTYVKFKLRTHYDTINDSEDPTYRAKCTLIQFAYLFKVNVASFEATRIESDLNYCS